MIDRFGNGILDEPRRFAAALADAFGPDHRRERNAVSIAVHEGVPKGLHARAVADAPHEMAVAELAARLDAETAMDAAMARWAVELLADVMLVAWSESKAPPSAVEAPRVSPAPNATSIGVASEKPRRVVVSVAIAAAIAIVLLSYVLLRSR